MLIKGLQKLTLLDFPGVISCIVFTGGCNMRCPFCHNASLVTHLSDEVIEEKEFFSYLESRKGKLDGVCITGGEPCIHKDLKSFIKRIKAMGFLVKLDTNGSRPDVLEGLLDVHLLDYVAMDVKNSFSNYEKTTGVKMDLELIKKSISLLKESSIPHEFRTTVVSELHTVDDIIEISKMVSPSKFYLQQFRESEDLIGNNLHGYEDAVLKEMRDACIPYSENVFVRGIQE